MMDLTTRISEAYALVSTHVSSSRLRHILRVANLSSEISKSTQVVDPSLAYLAGLLHDVTKQKKKEIHLQLFHEFSRQELGDFPSEAYHSFSASLFVRKELGWEDPRITEAIESHTLGSLTDSPLSLILFGADFLGSDFAFAHTNWVPWRKKTEKNLWFGCELKLHFSFQNLASKSLQPHPRLKAFQNRVHEFSNEVDPCLS